MIHRAVTALVAVSLAAPAAAQPGSPSAVSPRPLAARSLAAPPAPGAGPAELLGAANDALAAGDPAGAAIYARRALAADPTSIDRAEAHRALGLAYLLLGDRTAAEAAFVEYLVLDVEAHLDPTLVPPETIVFFEDVRARRAAELTQRRPRPRRRTPWLAAVPVAGQLQNGERGKAWLVGGAGVALLGVNLATYFWLRAHCDRADGTCSSGSPDPASADHEDLTSVGRAVQGVNIASFAALVALGVAATIDGVVVYRRQRRAELGALRPRIGRDGAGLTLDFTF